MADLTAPTRARLDYLLGHVPPQVNAGSWDLSIKFKAAIVRAIKVRHKRGLNEFEAGQQVRELERFWSNAP